jgi:hypothetical protein
MLFTFRNQHHYRLMYEAYGEADLLRHIKTTSVALKLLTQPGGRPYTKCAMNSAEDTPCSRDWSVPDGGDWFLKAAPFGEPNGDARQGWFLQMHHFENPDEIGSFNDWRSSISTGPLYFCIPRDD